MPTEEELKEEANRDATTSPYWVSVIYGDYGSWKTTTACSMVKERGLLLSADGSWKVLLNPRHSDIYSRIKKIVPMDGLSQLKHIDMSDYDTIIWDTVSHSVDKFLDLVYDEADWGMTNGKPRFRDKLNSKHEDLKDVQVLAPVDYRITRDAIRPILNRLFDDTEANIVFTSQVNDVIPGLSQNQQKRPTIPQATFKIIGTRADIIAHIKPGSGGKFVVDVTNGMTQLGKSRIEGIQGSMDSEVFVSKYKETVF